MLDFNKIGSCHQFLRYRNLEHARKTLCSTGIQSFPCGNCKSCTVQCQIGFDVKAKILDIARLQDVPEDFFR